MNEMERKTGEDYRMAIKMCKDRELKIQLMGNYINYLEEMVGKLGIMDKPTVHVTQRGE